MLQAFLVLPVFALAYLWAGQPSLGKRLWQLLAGLRRALAAARLVGGDRPANPGRRPALRGRLDGQQHPPAHLRLQRASGTARRTGTSRRQRAPAGGARRAGVPPGRLHGRRKFAVRRGDAGSPGCSSPTWAARSAWLFPAALIALAALLWLSRRSPRTDRTRAAALLWGGWLVRDRRGVQLHVRDHPPVLHRGPGPGDRRADRHRRDGALAAPAHLGRPRHPGGHAAGHRGLDLGAARPEPRLVPLAQGGHRGRGGRRGRDDPGRPGRPGHHGPGTHAPWPSPR